MKHKRNIRQNDSIHLPVSDMELTIKDSSVISELPKIASRIPEIKRNLASVPLNCNDSTAIAEQNVLCEMEHTKNRFEVEWTQRSRFFEDELTIMRDARSVVKDRYDKMRAELNKIDDKINDLTEKHRNNWLLTHIVKPSKHGIKRKRFLLAFFMAIAFQFFILILMTSGDGASLFITFDSTFQSLAAMGLLMTLTAAVGLELLPTIAGHVKALMEYRKGMLSDSEKSTENLDSLMVWHRGIWTVFIVLLVGITAYRFVNIGEMLQPSGGGFLADTTASATASNAKEVVLVLLFGILNFSSSMICYYISRATPYYILELYHLLENKYVLEEQIRIHQSAYKELTRRVYLISQEKKDRLDKRHDAEIEQIKSYHTCLLNEYKNQIQKKMTTAADVLVVDRLFAPIYKRISQVGRTARPAEAPDRVENISNYINEKEMEAS